MPPAGRPAAKLPAGPKATPFPVTAPGDEPHARADASDARHAGVAGDSGHGDPASNPGATPASSPASAPASAPAGAVTWRASWWPLAIASGLLAGAAAWWFLPAERVPEGAAGGVTDRDWHAAAPPPTPDGLSAPLPAAGQGLASTGTALPGAVAAQPPAAASPGPADAPRIVRQRDPAGDLSPDLADHVNEGERPSMAEVIQRLQAAGVNTGLGAFSPPGTRPPLIGLAVPEGFELPEGYVRHYQATDDGQRIEPILMFAPNHRLLDANQQPMALPADRVVPPELAPAGLPIRRIELPAPASEPRRGG